MNSTKVESEKCSSQKITFFFRKVKQQNALTPWLQISNPDTRCLLLYLIICKWLILSSSSNHGLVMISAGYCKELGILLDPGSLGSIKRSEALPLFFCCLFFFFLQTGDNQSARIPSKSHSSIAASMVQNGIMNLLQSYLLPSQNNTRPHKSSAETSAGSHIISTHALSDASKFIYPQSETNVRKWHLQDGLSFRLTSFIWW